MKGLVKKSRIQTLTEAMKLNDRCECRFKRKRVLKNGGENMLIVYGWCVYIVTVSMKLTSEDLRGIEANWAFED
jgi:hypothetical protein